MSRADKTLYFLLRFIQSLPNALFLGILIMMGVEGGLKKEIGLLRACLLGWIATAVLLVLHGRRSIKAVEEACHKSENVIID